MATPGRKSLVKVAGSPLTMTNEAMTTSDNMTYQISDPAKRVWDPKAPITVEVSTDGETWSEVTSGYKLNRLAGMVIFNTAQAPETQVRVSGQYLSVSTLGETYEYTYTIEADNQEATAFGDNWVKRKQGLLDVTAELSKFHVDLALFDALDADKTLVVEFYYDSSKTPLRAWMKLASDEVSSAVDGLVEESLEFEGTQDADGRVIARV